jgi:hypothetical protein
MAQIAFRFASFGARHEMIPVNHTVAIFPTTFTPTLTL